MSARVLLTGASGMLGRRTAVALLQAGYDVTVVQRSESGVAGVREVLGSITDAGVLARALEGVSAVVHAAAKVSMGGDLLEFTAVNVDATAALLAAARAGGVRDFVYVSSPSVAHYGSALESAGADAPDPARAHSLYSQTKGIAENLVIEAHSEEFRTVALRPHIIWGPGDAQLTERIVSRASQGRLPLLDDGAALVDTIYVDNAADALVAALARMDVVGGNRYVLTNGEPRPIGDIIAGMCLAAGVDAPRRRVASAIAKPLGDVLHLAWKLGKQRDEPLLTRFLAEQMSTAHWFDQREAQRDLAWQPRISIDEGLELLREHFAAN